MEIQTTEKPTARDVLAAGPDGVTVSTRLAPWHMPIVNVRLDKLGVGRSKYVRDLILKDVGLEE